MKVLVTGATGFVGSHLAETLAREGYGVRALARPSSDTGLLEKLGVEIVRGEITDVAAVEKAVEGCRQVYHVAGMTALRRGSRHEYYAINVEGTRNVATASLKAAIERLVYMSTVGVYGIIKSPPVDEGSKTSPDSPYQETKLEGEEVVSSCYKKEGLPVVIARLPGVLGPRSLIWLGLFQAIAKRRFRIIGSGENHTHTVYITDAVDGLRRCAETRGIEGECYLLADKEPITVKQLVNMLSQELEGHISPVRLPAFPYRAFYRLGSFVHKRFGFELPRAIAYELFLTDKVVCISKARKELGYEPKVSTKEGIQRTVEWYRQNGYL